MVSELVGRHQGADRYSRYRRLSTEKWIVLLMVRARGPALPRFEPAFSVKKAVFSHLTKPKKHKCDGKISMRTSAVLRGRETSARLSLKVLCTRFGKCLVYKQGNYGTD